MIGKATHARYLLAPGGALAAAFGIHLQTWQQATTIAVCAVIYLAALTAEAFLQHSHMQNLGYPAGRLPVPARPSARRARSSSSRWR